MQMTTKDPDYMKKYYKKNKAKMKKQMSDWYEKNKEEFKKYSKIYASEKKMVEKYNRPIKNIIRDRIIKEIKRYKINNILTLESKDFLFVKELPEKKFYIFENNKTEFNLMKKYKPKNTIINFGDISDFKDYDINIDCIYLDFCKTFSTEKGTIYLLKEKIRNCKIFAVTFCTYDETKEQDGDYQFQLVRELQELLEINFKVLFGQGYRDKGHSTMVTIILENPEN